MESYEGDANGPWSYYNANTGVTTTYSNGPVLRGSYSLASTNTTGWASLTKYQKRAAPWHPHEYYLCRTRFSTWSIVSYTVGSSGQKRRFVRQGYVAPVSFGTGNGTASNIPVSFFSADIAESKRRALANVQKSVSRFSVGLAQAMAERKQTANLLNQSVKRLVSFALLLRRGKFDELYQKYGIPKPVKTKSGAWVVPKYKRTQRTFSVAFDERGNPLAKPRKIRTVAYREVHTKRWVRFDNLWLEFQYGWTPLLNDIYDSAEAIANSYFRYKPLKFYGTGGFTRDFARPGPTISEGGAAQFPTELRGSVKCESRYVLECSEDNAMITMLSDTGLTNPAALAWELLPYSFVVDWFFPLGNYLQQLEYARGMTFLRGSVRTTVSLDARFQHLGKNVGATSSSFPWPGEIGGGPASVKVRHKKREILTGFPYSRFPTFRPELGLTRAISGLALITTLIKGDASSRKTMRYM